MSTVSLLDQLWPPAGAAPPSVEPPHATEVLILRRAVELFGRRGYEGTSVRAIATAAGVTAPLIAYHFGSKAGLFERCVGTVLGESVRSVLEAMDGAEDLVDGFRRYARRHRELAESYPDAVRFALVVAYGPQESMPGIDLVGHWVPVRERLVEALDRAVRAGAFRPRRGASLGVLADRLMALVHLDVFAADERRRWANDFARHDLDCQPFEDPERDLVDQFFHGAGEFLEPARPSEVQA